MAIILEVEQNGVWIPINAYDTDTVDGKHAVGTLNTTEKSNITTAINELLSKQEEIEMVIGMGGMI